MKPMSPMKPMEPRKATERWWPEELGEQPNSAGVQQHPSSSGRKITFTSQQGEVDLATLKPA
jgi:hypothetical protein